MRGNEIIVSAFPQGKFTEGIIRTGETPKPGTIMQRDPSAALQGGRHTYKVYDGSDSAFWVLREDNLQGKTYADAYAAGDRCFLYSPLPGEELNLLFANVAGTADDHALGEIGMAQSGTGKIAVSTGTASDEEVAQLLETVTDPAADFWAWVEWTGNQ